MANANNSDKMFNEFCRILGIVVLGLSIPIGGAYLTGYLLVEITSTDHTLVYTENGVSVTVKGYDKVDSEKCNKGREAGTRALDKLGASKYASFKCVLSDRVRPQVVVTYD